VTGWECMKAACAGFILPFAFVYAPVLLLRPSEHIVSEFLAILAVVLSIFACTVSVCSYWLTDCNRWERWLQLLCSVILLVSVPTHSIPLLILGGCLFAILTIVQMRRHRIVGSAVSAVAE